jgi:hypothetical protein
VAARSGILLLMVTRYVTSRRSLRRRGRSALCLATRGFLPVPGWGGRVMLDRLITSGRKSATGALTRLAVAAGAQSRPASGKAAAEVSGVVMRSAHDTW